VVGDRLIAALADRYRIERELGAGGMATVYLAEDLKHDRKVAIKVLRPELAAVIGAERFLKEIKTTANLQHPHILGLIDSGNADGSLWYAMPFVEGESLRDRLTREKQLPINDAVRIATEVAGALDYAHRHGVIHRDIKPENILLHDGSALVADFGIALAASTAGTRMTETGMSLGTPNYMSPEQAMGEREITARSDVYALGCVAYEMLVGEPPFTGPTAQAILARVMTEGPRALTAQRKSIPPGVEAAVFTALEKLPADRFASAAAFAVALSNVVPTAQRARPGSSEPPRSAPPRVRRISTAVPWILCGAAAIGMAMFAFQSWRRPANAEGEVVRAILELPAGTELSYPSVALSRDGSRIVVSARQGDRNILFQRALDNLAFAAVPGSEDGSRQFISPDGKWVAFASNKMMRKVPLDGGPAADIAKAAWAGGDWTEDGSILYSPDYMTGLWRVSAGGGSPERLTVPDSAQGELAHWWPQLLPDGDHVLFTAFRTPVERARIEVLSLKTGKRTVLLEGGVAGRYVTAGYLLFARNEALYAVPFDVRRLKMIGQPVPVIQDVAMKLVDGRAAFGVSDNGTLAYIAASTFVPDLELVWVNRRGEASASITAPGRFTGPALSADGHRIALAIARPGEPTGVWVIDPARGTRTALTPGGAMDFAPLFTPDGNHVIFASTRPIFDLYMRTTDGSSPATPLLVTSFDKVPESITADGRFLLFENHLLPHYEIWAAPLDGTGAAKSLLKSSAGDLNSPRISPNGRWLAYTSNESGRKEVFLCPYPAVTSARRQASADGGTDPRWTSAGRELVFRSGQRMMTVTVDPVSGQLGAPTELFRGNFENPALGSAYDVAPDGERFLMLHRPVGAEPRQVVVVTNWFKELRRLVPK
jgi:serine/threonine protein kinase/Tol biopolymer transport system component